MNTTPKQSPEFGIYTISKKYLAYIRQVDSNIVDPEITNTYVGPLCRVNGKHGPVDMFAPIDVAKYNSQEFFSSSCIDGIFAGFVDLTRMVPCLPAEYRPDNSNSNLKNFFANCEDIVKSYADKIAENSSLQIKP